MKTRSLNLKQRKVVLNLLKEVYQKLETNQIKSVEDPLIFRQIEKVSSILDIEPTEDNFFGGDGLVGKALLPYFSGKEFIDTDEIVSEVQDFNISTVKLLRKLG